MLPMTREHPDLLQRRYSPGSHFSYRQRIISVLLLQGLPSTWKRTSIQHRRQISSCNSNDIILGKAKSRTDKSHLQSSFCHLVSNQKICNMKGMTVHGSGGGYSVGLVTESPFVLNSGQDSPFSTTIPISSPPFTHWPHKSLPDKCHFPHHAVSGHIPLW